MQSFQGWCELMPSFQGWCELTPNFQRWCEFTLQFQRLCELTPHFTAIFRDGATSRHMFRDGANSGLIFRDAAHTRDIFLRAMHSLTCSYIYFKSTVVQPHCTTPGQQTNKGTLTLEKDQEFKYNITCTPSDTPPPSPVTFCNKLSLGPSAVIDIFVTST